MSDLRKCTKCKQEKPSTTEYFYAQTADYLDSRCIDCRKRIEQCRRYGITTEQYEHMLEVQDYKCKISGLHQDDCGTLHIDHCHTTNEIRGLLSGGANRALGCYEDSIWRHFKGAWYLLVSRIRNPWRNLR